MGEKYNNSSLVVENVDNDIKPPDMYRVILLNDDYTPMDFVVDMLRVVFHKNPAEATKIMLQVHRKGKGVAGVYVHDIAATKIRQVQQLARNEEYPLKCTMEKM